MKQAPQDTVVQAISLLQQGGRPKLLSATDERYCVRQVTKNRISSATKVAKELEKDTGREVSVDTVCRALHKAGLGAIEKPKKPLLSAKNIRKRLSWCMAHKDWTI
ncbi:hypothetical protein G6F33_013609 [Rhizopus arrhizus]|uniref:Transposase Tc1-like domain-containing protein n=1 Tax=Rhizopus oryzae TaxID=64495 RepID=A0A9P7BKW5_RHIOR|nr:hypothetical protein G6F33_013609 [Rhizopus arrhizus]KAG1272764.1 hypothetical protein G6F66_013295 [Rhizopus arrhizus]KAG1295560.1 hypothetical protein G6F64_013308 [Rhizopus arrhizus]